jgi:hypothetical protein
MEGRSPRGGGRMLRPALCPARRASVDLASASAGGSGVLVAT